MTDSGADEGFLSPYWQEHVWGNTNRDASVHVRHPKPSTSIAMFACEVCTGGAAALSSTRIIPRTNNNREMRRRSRNPEGCKCSLQRQQHIHILAGLFSDARRRGAICQRYKHSRISTCFSLCTSHLPFTPHRNTAPWMRRPPKQEDKQGPKHRQSAPLQFTTCTAAVFMHLVSCHMMLWVLTLPTVIVLGFVPPLLMCSHCVQHPTMATSDQENPYEWRVSDKSSIGKKSHNQKKTQDSWGQDGQNRSTVDCNRVCFSDHRPELVLQDHQRGPGIGLTQGELQWVCVWVWEMKKGEQRQKVIEDNKKADLWPAEFLYLVINVVR